MERRAPSPAGPFDFAQGRLAGRPSLHPPIADSKDYQSRRHQMAGVRLHDEPNVAAGSELECVAGGESEMDFHFDADVDAGGDNYVAPRE